MNKKETKKNDKEKIKCKKNEKYNKTILEGVGFFCLFLNSKKPVTLKTISSRYDYLLGVFCFCVCLVGFLFCF